jgi:hypothetical protein
LSLPIELDRLLGLSKNLNQNPVPMKFIGHDPIFPSTFRLGEAASVALAAQSIAICEIWRQRTGREQSVSINVAAAALSLESVLLLRQRGYPVPYPDVTYPLTCFHTCSDGRGIFLHGGYPLLRNGLLDLLNCPNSLDAINTAVLKWNSFDLEGSIDHPKLGPVYPNDYITGYLGAFGVSEALLRGASEGGSSHVKVSLSRTAMWIQSFPRFSPTPTEINVPSAVAESMAIERDTAYGRICYLGPVPRFSETSAYWSLSSAPLAANEACWPDGPAEPNSPPVPVNVAAPPLTPPCYNVSDWGYANGFCWQYFSP